MKKTKKECDNNQCLSCEKLFDCDKLGNEYNKDLRTLYAEFYKLDPKEKEFPGEHQRRYNVFLSNYRYLRQFNFSINDAVNNTILFFDKMKIEKLKEITETRRVLEAIYTKE